MMMRIKKTVIMSLIFFGILYTVFMIFFSNAYATGLLLGWGITLGNYVGLVIKVKGAFSKGYTRAIVFNSQLRLLATGVVLFMFFKYFDVNYLGLLVGLLLNAICIPFGAILEFRRNADGTSC